MEQIVRSAAAENTALLEWGLLQIDKILNWEWKETRMEKSRVSFHKQKPNRSISPPKRAPLRKTIMGRNQFMLELFLESCLIS